jgi:hypothetical protein
MHSIPRSSSNDCKVAKGSFKVVELSKFKDWLPRTEIRDERKRATANMFGNYEVELNHS